MTILSIAASGIVAATAAFFAFSAAAPRTASSDTSRPNPHLRADQRGMTLQTLIIMAVLVAIATGGSVVLVGITRGANDGLENAGKTSSAAKCEPWEILDPDYESQGIGGPTGLGGVLSSKIGCIRACFIRFGIGQPDYNDTDIPKVLTYEDEATRRPPGGRAKAYVSLEFHRGEDRLATPVRLPPGIDPDAPAGSFTKGIFSVVSSQAYAVAQVPVPGLRIPPQLREINEVIPNPPLNSDPIPIGDLEIRVADDLRSCILWDPANSKEIFRSEGTI